MKNQYRGKTSSENRVAVIGVIIVVLCLAGMIYLSEEKLKQKEHEYGLIEESLDRDILEEMQKKDELNKQRDEVNSPEYIMEKAREIFGLKLPDEIIIRPEEK